MKAVFKVHHPLLSCKFILQLLSRGIKILYLSILLYCTVKYGLVGTTGRKVCKDPPKALVAGNRDLKILADVPCSIL